MGTVGYTSLGTLTYNWLWFSVDGKMGTVEYTSLGMLTYNWL